ncbi:DNA topoisomerase 3 [Bacillus sp. Brlt_9]|uniref:DNA topoisomerase 3 n=1 Tax=Bacillus sp. Brlt_9 TaxID=3110916 RepID=UPI003F7C53BC
MRLVIAEKPDMAKAYADAMSHTGRFTKGNGYFKNNQYVITWAFGHLVNSKEPVDYPDEFGGWNWESIPFIPPSGELEYHSPNKTEFDKVRKGQLKNIKTVCKEIAFDEVINGADAGREGDLIFWEIYNVLKLKAPVKRLWVQSKVDEDIQKAFNNLKDEDFFIPRKESAFSRQFADWVLGHNLTVGFTVKTGKTLHVGRVQTPTLSLLVKRRLEIENFKPKTYFEIKAKFGDKYDGMWFKDSKSNTKFETKDAAMEVIKKISNQTATVTNKDVIEQKVNPKELFDLSSLQREANKKFGFTMQKTLEVAQLLYDKYKVTSYPRTDSKYIMSSQVAELPQLLNPLKNDKYGEFVDNIINRGIPTSKKFVNDKKVTDHYAIIPTKKKLDPNEVVDDKTATKQEILQLHDLIVRRFLSVFYPEAIYEKTEIVTEVQGETFKTNGRILKDAGWEVVYGKDVNETDEESDNDEKTLPPIEKGEESVTKTSDPIQKQTKAPPHYNDSTLGGAMENARDYLEEENLKEEMKEAKAGLGTVATRAQIVENLISRNYIARKGKQLIATDLGVNLINIAPERLKSPDVTAEWERELRLMEEEQVQREDFYERIVQFVTEELGELKNKEIDINFEEADSVGKCPKCGQDITEFPKGFACKSSSRENTCFLIWKGFLNKKITASHLKRILEKGESSLIKGFKTKAGKTFDAKLKFNESYTGMDFVFENAEIKELDSHCPKCSKKVIERGNFIYCETNTKENPCLFISKEVGGKKLSNKAIKDLLEKGESDLIDGFKSKTKKTKFSAHLVLKNGRVEYKFPERKVVEKKSTDLKCPCCGGDVIETEKKFGCGNYATNKCTFTVWKNIGGKPITIDLIKEVLTAQKTEKLDGFISKAGKAYQARLVWNEAKKTIEMSFE